MNILENIFSFIYKCEKADAMHNRITLFNLIKLNYLNDVAKNLSKENNFIQYKKKNIDIRTVPKAKGQLRKIQLANLALLLELDKVCKANGFRYWLDFGNAIGAIRHKGFIPWDDDIDVGMLREDYNKLIQAFEKTSQDSQIFAGYYRHKQQCFIKIQHKDNPNLFVDVFPYDLYEKKLTLEKKKEKNKLIINLRNYIARNYNKNSTNEEHLKWIHNLQNEKILKNGSEKEDQHPDIFWGLDYPHPYSTWFFDYETFFPLKNIEYEGYQLPVINKLDTYLNSLFGDFMSYPSLKDMKHKHSMFAKMTEKELEVLDFLANSISKNEERYVK